MHWKSIQLLAIAVATPLSVYARPQGGAKQYCWKTLAPLRTPRQEHGTAAAGNQIFIIGGLLEGEPVDTVEVYDVQKNSWSDSAKLPAAYHHPNIATVDGKIYVLGGINNRQGWKSNPASYRFDPASPTKKWEELAPMTVPRGSSVLGVYGKTIWVAGGLQTKLDADPKSTGSKSMQSMATLSSYDTVANKWTDYDSVKLPSILDHAGGAVVGDTFYVLGGRTSGPTTNQQAAYALNLKASTKWDKLADMPSKRGGIGAAAAGKRIFTFGGEGNNATASGVFSEVEVFDTEGRAWASEGPMKNPRHGFGAVSVGDIVYLPGGGIKQGGGSPVDIFEAYEPC